MAQAGRLPGGDAEHGRQLDFAAWRGHHPGMKLLTEWDKLPRFIIGDDGEDRDFVVHLHYPRFVMEFDGNAGTPLFIDSEEDFARDELAAGREPSSTLAKLMREAGEFFAEHMAGDD
jgi:hypothetical protein